MMTDPLKPLGLSVWQLTAARPMYIAGGRLFVDVTDILASPAGRKIWLDGMGHPDPLIKDALMTVIERGDFREIRCTPSFGRDSTFSVGAERKGRSEAMSASLSSEAAFAPNRVIA